MKNWLYKFLGHRKLYKMTSVNKIYVSDFSRYCAIREAIEHPGNDGRYFLGSVSLGRVTPFDFEGMSVRLCCFSDMAAGDNGCDLSFSGLPFVFGSLGEAYQGLKRLNLPGTVIIGYKDWLGNIKVLGNKRWVDEEEI